MERFRQRCALYMLGRRSTKVWSWPERLCSYPHHSRKLKARRPFGAPLGIGRSYKIFGHSTGAAILPVRFHRCSYLDSSAQQLLQCFLVQDLEYCFASSGGRDYTFQEVFGRQIVRVERLGCIVCARIPSARHCTRGCGLQ